MGFASKVIDWQRQYGRHDLPWQGQRDPYLVWLSEIMLQQTQVIAVVPYYARFVRRFPNLHTLAEASLDEALAVWSGLGYYARARNLYQAARHVAYKLDGRFPSDYQAVCALPGVGLSTAAAICVFAFGQRHAILDGNVKRVLSRYFGISGYPGDKAVAALLWKKSKRLLPTEDVSAYTQGLMDLGATVCTRVKPHCDRCPVKQRCVAFRDHRVSQLPTPKPRKTLPLKQIAMLVLVRNGEILLEKRASLGIWGGLWSLPEASLEENVAARCAQQFGIKIKSLERLPELHHGFTHFKLRITPNIIAVASASTTAEQPGNIWLTIADALGAAIPVPVRRILSQLDEKGR